MLAATPPAADPTPLHTLSTPSTLRSLLDSRTLLTHFQPIGQLDDGHLRGFEALVRTPPGSPWRTPDELFAAARREGLTIELEIACVRAALWHWTQHSGQGELFINLSASGLAAALSHRGLQAAFDALPGCGTQTRVVVELTEHERVSDHDALMQAVQRLRRRGFSLALDDFGDGRSSLRLWSELKPEIVKIDKYFVRDLHLHADKVQTLRALLQISHTLGADIVAEGIETVDELRVVRDLGIRLGQGWLLGRPAPVPVQALPAEVVDAVRGRQVAVLPQRSHAGGHRLTAAQLLIEAPALPPDSSADGVFRFFSQHPDQPSVAIVDEGRPLALIGRQKFVSDYAKPYFRELFGRRPCVQQANTRPLVLDLQAGIEELAGVLTSEDQHYLTDGFIIAERGLYRGLGTGQQLVRTVTEARIEAARHANPLTFLPGNIPISDHIRRLLDRGQNFHAAYADLNHFKPFNDHYGYWRGDEMIRLAAQTLVAMVDPQRDFVGHVGGDDFVVLFQSADWAERCERITRVFNEQARTLFDEQALAANGIEAEDRHGQMRFHPLTTLSIGVVRVPAGCYHDPEEVASAAASAKWQAKKSGLDVCVLAEEGAGG